MAEYIEFDFVSPERRLMSGEVAQVVVPGWEGEFAVLPGHAPVLSTMRPGVLSIVREVGGEAGGDEPSDGDLSDGDLSDGDL